MPHPTRGASTGVEECGSWVCAGVAFLSYEDPSVVIHIIVLTLQVTLTEIGVRSNDRHANATEHSRW
ncbi:hypothetical protein E2562_032924 [Oryza meyeriana var. granulata]|uniref:Uncharacterized protein n=1 Tax=Oryza meyeriana var. granulata TaxID=110450 RepID=A0A6G1F0V3_9ORYZ|nr:hypothetical protein E2562_032924 [Oryza meyeriana var. granulata]